MKVLDNILAWSFGGLPLLYYFKQIAVGVIIFLIVVAVSEKAYAIGQRDLLSDAINVLLYPYSRFVYDSLKEIIVGKKGGGGGFSTLHMVLCAFRLSGLALIITIAFKLLILLVFFFGAPIIGLVGLVWLYIMHAREAKVYGETL